MKISCNNMKIHSLIWAGAIFATGWGKNFFLVECEYEYEFECEYEYEYSDLFADNLNGAW